MAGVLFPARFWDGLADGSVTVAFRRWKRATVRAGGTLQAPAGLLAIDEVTPIEPGDITDADAQAAGYTSVDEVMSSLRPEGTLHRIRFHRVGPAPRIALRERAPDSEEELTKLRASLDRL